MTKTTTKHNGNASTIEQLANRAHELAAHGRELAIEADRLEQQIRLARGTREISPLLRRRASGAYGGREADNISTPALYETIRDLVAARPMRFRDLVEATQAGENRIKGVIVRLQRDGVGLLNLGDQAKALWFIPSDETRKRITKRDRR